MEACRRDNTSLLQEVLSHPDVSKDPSSLLNTARDGVGNYCLHIAAQSGSYDVMDVLLDQEGLEVDPVDRMEGDTPLHKAVRFVNSLGKEDWEGGAAIVELLLDAGADAKIRNKAKLKPVDLVDPRNENLRSTLQTAEYAQIAGDDVVEEDNEEEQGVAGSGSDSD